MAKKQSKERPVIVTTARRGVFFGYSDYTEGDEVYADDVPHGGGRYDRTDADARAFGYVRR